MSALASRGSGEPQIEPITPIFQFGTSRFLQAHAALFIHEALEKAEAAGPITVVRISGSASTRQRLRALSDVGGYRVIIRGLESGRSIERELRVRSIRRALDAQSDWKVLADLFAEQAEFVISNTTESGFSIPPDLQVDLSGLPEVAPASFPAKLLALLNHVFMNSGRHITLLPTELIPRNGDVLRATILGLARRSGASRAFLAFIHDCVFANSLVDRIVSSALEPAGAVAEPYALWAVEDDPRLRLPCRHPAIVRVPDLEPTERLKLHILNLGHTVLAHQWMARGLKSDLTVREMLAIPDFRKMLSELYRTEVLPGFASRGMATESQAYAAMTLERFDNPFLDHRLSDIAMGHQTKVARRIAGFLDWIGAEQSLSCKGLREIVGASTVQGPTGL